MANNELTESFKVFIRIRPFLNKELVCFEKDNVKPESIFEVDDKAITVVEPVSFLRREKDFYFDGIFNEKDHNFNVFKAAIEPQLDNLFNGFNSTALAYGITGTGKTYTVFGDLNEQSEVGLIVLASDYLFNKIKQIENILKLLIMFI